MEGQITFFPVQTQSQNKDQRRGDAYLETDVSTDPLPLGECRAPHLATWLAFLFQDLL